VQKKIDCEDGTEKSKRRSREITPGGVRVGYDLGLRGNNDAKLGGKEPGNKTGERQNSVSKKKKDLMVQWDEAPDRVW